MEDFIIQNFSWNVNAQTLFTNRSTLGIDKIPNTFRIIGLHKTVRFCLSHKNKIVLEGKLSYVFVVDVDNHEKDYIKDIRNIMVIIRID